MPTKPAEHKLTPAKDVIVLDVTGKALGDRSLPQAKQFLVALGTGPRAKVVKTLLPALPAMLAHKEEAARSREIESLIDELTSRFVETFDPEIEMANRIAARRARILNEFGYLTSGQIAERQQSASKNPASLAATWKSRGQIFSVPDPNRKYNRELYPAFQFDPETWKPMPVIGRVLKLLRDKKSPWKFATWFCTANGWLPESARPVDLLIADPDAVVRAAEIAATEPAV